MLPILHLVSEREWADASAASRYRPESLEREGFVHFSTADQLAATAERFYRSVPDLMVVLFDGDTLDVRFEAPVDVVPGGWEERFPHVYEELVTAEALAVVAYSPAEPWRLPGELPSQPSIDGCSFVPVPGRQDGEVGVDTVFDYTESSDGTIVAEYRGGGIIDGRLVGWRALDRLRFHYCQVSVDGEISAGRCQSRICVAVDGRLELHERWHWSSRDGSGRSTLVER